MKLLVWNINSLVPTVRNAVLKYGSWLGFFEEHGIDILCLQETKLTEEKLSQEVCIVEGYQSFWATSRERKGYSGVATYASTAFAPVFSEADCLESGEGDIDREGRMVLTDHKHFVLINVYVPNAGDRPNRSRLPFKLRFLEALKRKCDALVAAGREVMIVGDFNVPAEQWDIHPALGPLAELYGQEELAALAGLMAACPDVWRRLHPDDSSTFSVWDEKTSARAFNQGLRIDYILATPGLQERVVSCEILGTDVLPPKWSDHAGILLELRDMPPLSPHPPCPAWQRLHRRFVDSGQKSILSMFGKKRAAPEAATHLAAAGGAAGKSTAAAGAGAGAGAGAADGEGGSGNQSRQQQDEAQLKKARLSGDAAAAAKAAVQGGVGGPQDDGSGGGDEQQQDEEGSKQLANSSSGKQQQQQQQQRRRQQGSSVGAARQGKGGGGGKAKQVAKQTQAELKPGQRTIGSFFASASTTK